MDHTLRCNVLKCRKELNDHAVVTTCCHVFCIDCSNKCQLSGQREGHRPICPACDMQLTNPDDVVVANLNPTEDYKTSVLSGLNPNVIMECAGRALNFWAYQTMQEIVYQEYLAKNLTDKYSTLNMQMDKMVNDANGQISHLRGKLQGLQADQDSLRRKNEELTQALREKSRKLLQTQELYDKLKRRAMLGQVQDAAHDAVDDTILASTTANRFVDKFSAQSQDQGQNQRPRSHPIYYNMQSGGDQPATRATHSGMDMMPPGFNRGGGAGADGGWPGFGSQGSQGGLSQNQPIQTPSTHRQRLHPINNPAPRIGLSNIQTNSMSDTLMPQRLSPRGRQPLMNLNSNSAGGNGFAGYGMSAGMKVSNPASSVANVVGRPVIRSRVAQRPGSDGSGGSGGRSSKFPARNSTFGVAPSANMFFNGDTYY